MRARVKTKEISKRDTLDGLRFDVEYTVAKVSVILHSA
jgi:hypothetical protein